MGKRTVAYITEKVRFLEKRSVKEIESMNYSVFRCHLRVHPGSAALPVTLLLSSAKEMQTSHTNK